MEIGKDGPQMLEVKMFIIKKYSYSIICTCEYDIFIFKKVQLTLWIEKVESVLAYVLILCFYNI